MPKLVDDIDPKTIPLAVIQKVLQNLLMEGVHIRDMRTIIETISEHATKSQDSNELTSLVRVQLGRAITQQLFPESNEVTVIAFEQNLENLLLQAMQGGNAKSNVIEPGLADTLVQKTSVAARQQETMGLTPVLLVPAPLRAALAKFLRRAVPHLRVVSHEELPETKTIRVVSLIGGQV